MHVLLVRRSDFNPTRIIGVVGQKCKTSGYHWNRLAVLSQTRLLGLAYLVHNVLQRRRAINRKTNKQQVGLGVGERAQTIVLFLTSSIPESQLDRLSRSPMNCLCDIVFENGGNVFLAASQLHIPNHGRELPRNPPLGSTLASN